MPPPPDVGPRELDPRPGSKATFAELVEDEKREEQKPCDFAGWMGRLEAKLDAVLELVQSSNKRPTVMRQLSTRSAPTVGRVSCRSGGAGPQLPLMLELLGRGRRASPEAEMESAERSSACAEQGARHGRCRDDEVHQPHKQAHEDEDALSPKSAGRLRESAAAAALAQEEHAQGVRERAARLNGKLQEKLARTRIRSSTVSTSSIDKRIMSGQVGSAKLGSVRTVVMSPRFDTCVTVLIVSNAFLIGAQVQDYATSGTILPLFGYFGQVYTGLFTLELFARMYVHRLEFFSSPMEGSWNMFDTLLVFISWIDVCLTLISIDALPQYWQSTKFISKLGRTIRILRILRIIRTVRFCNQLRLILKQLVSSLQSLLWVFVILMAVIYTIAVILTQSAADYLILEASTDSDLDTLPLRQRFGTLFDTMYTLFQCISGGRGWGDVSILMRGPGWVSEAVLIMYVFFSVFAMVNIINGVFVDGARELARRDRMHQIERQRIENTEKEQHLVDLLMAVDQNGDNAISYDEWLRALERGEIREYISALHIESVDAKALFTLLDANGSGKVNVGEFVSGMMALQGEARSIDVQMLLYENKRLISMLCGLMDFVDERFSDVPVDPTTLVSGLGAGNALTV